MTSSRAEIFTAPRSRLPPISRAIALAQFVNISERRSDRLVDPSLSDLPGVSDVRQRPAFGLHARAGHRGRARV